MRIAGYRPTVYMKHSRTSVHFRLIVTVVSLMAAVAPIGFAQMQSHGSSAITGSVRDGAGNGVGDAFVCLQAQGDTRAEERKTDPTGNFGFSGLKTGAYVLSAS